MEFSKNFISQSYITWFKSQEKKETFFLAFIWLKIEKKCSYNN
jgi:hypothetical protein